MLKDQDKVDRALVDGKLKMSMCFRWYLGLSSFWANAGIDGREKDYQVWCGPAMGAFNDFARGTYLDVDVAKAFPQVAEINRQLLRGACYLQRLQQVRYEPALRGAVDIAAIASFVPVE